MNTLTISEKQYKNKMKNAMTELKNSIGSHTRLEQEERINELYEISIKIIQPKEQ